MMPKPEETIKIALDETRMLVLVVQVLLGFSYQGVFQPGFQRLTSSAHVADFIVFCFLITTLGLLLMIPAQHRLGEKGRDNARFCTFATNTLSWSLLPFAFAMTLQIFIVAGTVLNASAAIYAALAIFIITMATWYAVPLVRNRLQRKNLRHLSNDMKNERPPLQDRINQVLTECRIVIPGTQALLGFQFIAFLTDAFTKLPPEQKILHFAALITILIAAILLMFPAAFHRIGEEGENTQMLLRFSHVALLIALAALALGISLDFFIVSYLIWNSSAIAFCCALGSVGLLSGLWYAIPLLNRARLSRRT